jgi:hypothetical protein
MRARSEPLAGPGVDVRLRDGRIRALLLAGGELDLDEGVAQDALAHGARAVVEADASDHRRSRDAPREEQAVQRVGVGGAHLC